MITQQEINTRALEIAYSRADEAYKIHIKLGPNNWLIRARAHDEWKKIFNQTFLDTWNKYSGVKIVNAEIQTRAAEKLIGDIADKIRSGIQDRKET